MKLNFFRNTACGHNDFCSVRLNGPTWRFILTHRYRLSLSQFTEAVMVESATGPLLLRKSKSLPTQKCHAPPAVAESSRLIDIVYPNNSAIFVENRSFQIVPKRECAMNTQSRRHDIYPHRYIDVPRFLTNLSHEKMNIVKLFM